MDDKHAVLNPAKIKYRILETRLNPCLIYLSRLGQIHVELTNENMEACCGSGGSYLFCKKSGMTLRYDVRMFINTVVNFRGNSQKCKKSLACKITIFHTDSGATTLTLSKYW